MWGPPILDDPGNGTSFPKDPARLFREAQAADRDVFPGPCLVEPESGAMMPSNWMRPRFRFVPRSGQNIFELRVHTEGSSSSDDLLVYTTATVWKMAPSLWTSLSPRLYGQRITVTVRAAILDDSNANDPNIGGTVYVGDAATFAVAPRDATVDGTIAFWSGSESVNPTLQFARPWTSEGLGTRPLELTGVANAPAGQCQGCHVPDPDGVFTAYAQVTDPSSTAGSLVNVRSLDGSVKQPTWKNWQLGKARQILALGTMSTPSFSRGHFKADNRYLITTRDTSNGSEIAWVNLEADSTNQYDPRFPTQKAGWGVVPRFMMGMGGGDQGQAASPVFSHNGDFIVYVSASSVTNGFIVNDGDIKTVPWNQSLGGAAAAVGGAHEPPNEYAPSLSPDDRFIAFVRAPMGTSSFANPQATIYIVPRNGGTATGLAANQPQQSSCARSGIEGLGNSSPHWAPSLVRIGSLTYYWLIYSSKRLEAAHSQIFVSAVIVDDSRFPPAISSTSPLYLWNQPENVSNHNPFWEELMPDQIQGLQ